MKMNMISDCIKKFADFERTLKTDEATWSEAEQEFYHALSAKIQADNLERANLDKKSWYLPIKCKFKLLEKAKLAGCDSYEFWKDYYTYRATYLNSNHPDRPFALKMANGKYL